MQSQQSVRKLLLILLGSVFLSELMVMFVLDLLPPQPHFIGFLLDAMLLVLLLFPIFYFLVYRPLLKNISDLQRIEKELGILSVAFESKDPILITDVDANILRANKMFLRMSGYAMEELVGQNPRLFQTGRYSQSYYEKMWKQLLHSGSWSGETKLRDKRGVGIPMGMVITAVKNENNEITHYVAIYNPCLSGCHRHPLAVVC